MRALLPVLLLAAALSGCTDDAGPEPTAAASSHAPAQPVACSRISATDLSALVGEDLTVQDVSESSGTEGATVCTAAGTAVVVNWLVEPGSPEPPPDTVDVTTVRVSAQGEAADGRTTTATAVLNPGTGGPDVPAATLRASAEAVVAAYAEEGEPAPEGDQCHVLSDAEVSALAGFPVTVRDQVASGGDLDCTTLVGDGEDQEGPATLTWSLTQPSQTLTAVAGRDGRATEEITLPGEEPAVVSYDAGDAVVAAQAGERTIVVEVSSQVDESELPEARVRELAGDLADAYAG